MEGYYSRYGLKEWAIQRYQVMDKKAGDCIQCGACEPRCPYNLPIREMMKKTKEIFGM
jgi:predicted aldo/keto reductase-like oxidoreductase